MDDIKREDVNKDETNIDIPVSDSVVTGVTDGNEINIENSNIPPEETVDPSEKTVDVNSCPEEIPVTAVPFETNEKQDNSVAPETSETVFTEASEARDEQIRDYSFEHTTGESVYSGGARYSYDPSGSVDEPSFMRANAARKTASENGYQQYGQNDGNIRRDGAGDGQQPGMNTSYGYYYGQQSGGYAGSNSSQYGQPTGGSPAQDRFYSQTTGNGSFRGGSYGQQAGSGPVQGSSCGQQAGSGPAQGVSYGQQAGSGPAQGGSYGQQAGSGPAQGSSYGQRTGNRTGGNAQDGSYGQYAGNGSSQNDSYGQQAGSGSVQGGSQGQQNGGRTVGGNSAQNGRYANDGYGKGKTGYSSNYDSYRFETPVDPAPINSGDTRYKKKKVRKNKDGSEKKDNGGNLKKAGLIAGIAVVFGLVAAIVFIAVTSLAGLKVSEPTENKSGEITAVPTPEIILGDPETETETDSQSKSVGTYDAVAESPELTVPQVVEQCMPSMVAITNTTIEEYQDFFGGTSQQESVSAGSGIIVGETETELLIATNNHVIQNSKDITVTFIDEAVIQGSVKGMDADNDLAIVAVKLDDISKETRDAIRIITIGDSDAMVVGESVVAIGNALGYGQSVSAGIISALGREVNIDGQSHSLIQTDASINPGNSGGALINMRGELIGINEVKYVDETVEGVGYAIPMATAEPILDSLGSKTARQKVDDDQASYIGIKCIDVPSYYVQAGYPSGVYVSEVTAGGPAEAAGLKEGDIITAIDGISVSSSSQLINYLQYYAAGEVIEFSVSRLNEDNTAFKGSKIPITLGSKKDAGLLDDNESKSDSEEGDDASEEEEPSEEAPSEEAPSEEAPEENGDGFGGFPFLPEVENR